MSLGTRSGLEANGWLVSVRQGDATARVSWSGGPTSERYDVMYPALDILLDSLAETGISQVSVHLGRGGRFDMAVPAGLDVTFEGVGFGWLG